MKHGTIEVLEIETGADYFFIGSLAYAICGRGDVAFSNYGQSGWRSFGDWEVSFSPNGAIASLRNQKTQQWHGQNTGLIFTSLTTDHFIDPVGMMNKEVRGAAYYGFRIESVIDFITARIPPFVPFQSQSQYA